MNWFSYDRDLRHERIKSSFDRDDKGLVHLMTDTIVKPETQMLACKRQSIKINFFTRKSNVFV